MKPREKDSRPNDEQTAETLRFAARGIAVFDNLRRLVCRARSGNMAKRIANALNWYAPDERGQ